MSKLPLVMLGGTLCDARLWQEVIACLPDAPPIVTPALQGAHSADEMAQQLLNELPPRFLLCGFSLGAIVALHMMAQAPSRLAGLALIAVNPLADRAENAPMRQAAVEHARQQGMTRVIDALWPRYVAPIRLPDMALRQKILDMAQACGVDVFQQHTDIAMHRRDVRPTLAAQTFPVTLIGGAQDPICTPEHHALLTQVYPSARWHSLPNCGHFVPFEAPQETAVALSAWIKESTCELTL